ncbi:SHIPPO repeat domain-containing protein [Histomonas meleagridis]|nr:SHIPPO repeat domain-containing protein [Histomonas meleagridis]
MKEFEDTPGPNYVPPPLGADAPKATITSRHSETRDSRLDNPGPGAYNIQPKFANDANKFTMHSRTNTGEVDSCSPGPGAYMPNIDAVKKRAPSASMHIRPKDQDISVTPGPSDYVVSRDLGGKSSTIGCKTKDRDISVTPGPADYSPNDNKPKSPQFTMKGRHETKQEVIAAPYRDIGSTIGQGPKITMSSRHKMKEFEDTPGPNYVPPPLGADAPKATITSRHSETRDSRLDNPGPGAYNIQPKFANDANKFTMHSRTNTGEVDSCSPGPGAYMPNIDAVKKRAPSASMHIRPKDQDISVTPGPSDYVVSRDLGAKSSTIGCKTKDRDISVTPGPADYSPNDNKPKLPQLTMKRTT